MKKLYLGSSILVTDMVTSCVPAQQTQRSINTALDGTVFVQVGTTSACWNVEGYCTMDGLSFLRQAERNGNYIKIKDVSSDVCYGYISSLTIGKAWRDRYVPFTVQLVGGTIL